MAGAGGDGLGRIFSESGVGFGKLAEYKNTAPLAFDHLRTDAGKAEAHRDL